MDDSYLYIIKDYIDECLIFRSEETLNIEDFETQRYSEWAAGEILSRASDEVFKPPSYITGIMTKDVIDILEEFAFEMECASDRSDEEHFKKMFETAKETADNILYFVIQERRKNGKYRWRRKDI